MNARIPIVTREEQLNLKLHKLKRTFGKAFRSIISISRPGATSPPQRLPAPRREQAGSRERRSASRPSQGTNHPAGTWRSCRRRHHQVDVEQLLQKIGAAEQYLAGNWTGCAARGAEHPRLIPRQMTDRLTLTVCCNQAGCRARRPSASRPRSMTPSTTTSPPSRTSSSSRPR